MSIANEITNYANGLGDAYGAVNDMGGIIPQDKNMNNLDTAIRTIPQSTGPTYTAGTGIDITNDVISIDHTVVAELTDLPGVFTGATASTAGTSGLVPAPQIGEEGYLLCGNGTWVPVTLPTYIAGTGIDITNDVISFDDTVLTHGALEFQTGQGIYTFTENSSNQTTTIVIPEYSDFTGATSSVAGSNGLVPAPAAGDQEKVLHGDGTWKDTTAKLVEMSYGESNAWAKFISAYNAGSIVYCRASSNANPATGSQTRKAFMAYVNNATNPTNVEFQYVRSQSSKTDSQQTDQVFVYTLTNASGGTWSVASRNMGPKINVSGPITKTFTSGANATITIGADAMTGATSSAAGAAGVVPAPAAGEVDYVLKGNGTWGIAGQFEISVNGDLTTDSTITEVTSGGGPAAAFVRTLLDSGWTVSIHDDNNKMYIVTSASDSQVTAIDTSGNIVTIVASSTPGTFDVTRKVVPIITMTSTDPGEGGQLDANNFIFVYEV